MLSVLTLFLRGSSATFIESLMGQSHFCQWYRTRIYDMIYAGAHNSGCWVIHTTRQRLYLSFYKLHCRALVVVRFQRYLLSICHIFEFGDLQLLESTRSSTPGRGFPPITLLLGMLYCLFFKAWKAIDSLMCVPNFLFSDVYLKLWFNFKDGPSLDLSCRMSSVFIIILIIHIIKTASFNKTILMVELEGKSLLSRWSLLTDDLSSSSYFYKIFGMHLQKGLVYL